MSHTLILTLIPVCGGVVAVAVGVTQTWLERRYQHAVHMDDERRSGE